MPKKKKPVEEVEESSGGGESESESEGESEGEGEVAKITPLDVEFGREDLNQMRDKINELIRHC